MLNNSSNFSFFPGTKRIRTQLLDLEELREKDCMAGVLRLDEIHPVVSGNKWFKLKYHFIEAMYHKHPCVLTYGGAWSNHIIATAWLAKEHGLASIGIIRGEEPARLSATLNAARSFGMVLEFVSRRDFATDKEAISEGQWHPHHPQAYVIPEGGAGPPGIKGSEEILQSVDFERYTHIMCCIGTATMYSGLVNGAVQNQDVIGIPVLKGMNDPLIHIGKHLREPSKLAQCRIFHDYHFGGYGKKTPELLLFMNRFFGLTQIPTDFVYTGKLLFAFFDLLKKGYFRAGSKVLIIHSGGLQGNGSLKPGDLVFNQ